MEISNQKSGDSSVNLQAGRDNNMTVIVSSMEVIVDGVVKAVTGEVTQKVNEIAEKRVQDYLKDFEERLAKKPDLLENYSKNIDTPDFQFVARQAIITSARTESSDLRKVLTGLVEGRLGSVDELKTIAYNQSIESINKLTNDHLKIISLIFLCRHVFYKDIISWDTFNKHLAEKLSKFFDFRDTKSQFQYLNYAGHSRTSVLTWDAFEAIKTNYSFLFQEPILKKVIDDLSGLFDKVKPILAEIKNENGDECYKIRSINKEDLKEFLENNVISVESGEGLELINIYNGSIKKQKDFFIEKTGGPEGLGSKFLKIITETQIQSTELTLVGIVTAVTNIDTICGGVTNIDEWIND
jgi:hypothetical protein